jgi:4-diphosphocytidyl-2-C-methyl-D-erythritol kinase
MSLSEPFRTTIAAPAKLNLTLDVQAPRPDGYHELDSIVAPLTTADELTVTVKPGPRQVRLIVRDRRPSAIATDVVPKGDANLAHRAATLLLDTAAPDAAMQVWITLTKRLPLQAGLGAGSSDAASVLKAVGSALRTPSDTLVAVASTLGSDVALFLADGPVRMQGRGERVASLPVRLPTLHGVLARPCVGVPTADAYRALDAVPQRVPGQATGALLAALERGEPLGPFLANDFDAPIRAAYPSIEDVSARLLSAGAQSTLLCGSGSCVFGLARSRAHGVEIVRSVAGSVAWIKLVQTA